MKIAVLGAGAIGGWLGSRLAQAGREVMAMGSAGPLEKLTICQGERSAGVVFTTFDGPAELLIVAVKATGLQQAATRADTLIDAHTIILPLLNGVPWWFTGQCLASVDPDGTIGASLPATQVVGAVVHASASRPRPGKILVKHVDKLILGEPSGERSERVERLCALFEGAGIPCEASADIRRAIWYKLWGNATINPLSALTRATCDRILADPECRAWMLAGMAELAKVGAAIECPIAESGEDRMAVTARLGAFKTSMLQDVEAGRPIELEALLGAPREIARGHGIATPALDRLYHLTKLLADSL